MSPRVTPRQLPVLLELVDSYECEMLTSFHNIASSLQMYESDVRTICRALKRRGLTEHMPSFTDDGYLSGSGYQLTALGYKLAKELQP